MTLEVLGSSSAGNCYILKSEEEVLVIETGLPFSVLSKALDYNFDKVSGCIVSHRHGDHSKSLDKLDGMIDIYCGEDVAKHKGLKHYTAIEPMRVFEVGGFDVMPFEVIHDVPCFGFFIQHKAMGKLAFITDSAYADYTFKGVNHLLVECNYTTDALYRAIASGHTPAFQKNRLFKTHMELQETINVIRSNKTDDLVNVVLLHLSERNSDEAFMLESIKGSLGLNAKVAKKKLIINLTKTLPY